MYQLDSYAISHIGERRRKQEDNLYLGNSQYMDQKLIEGFSLPDNPVVTMKCTSALNKELFVAVSDGMGGHKSGETASRIVVEHLSAIEKAVHFRNINEQPEDVINQMIVLINDLILKHSQQDPALHDMGATLSGVFFLGGRAFTVNIGDSRVYLMRAGNLSRLTQDHTEERIFRELGMNDRIPPGKGRLMRYFGFKQEYGCLSADIIPIPTLQPGDRYLICTDGLTDEIPDQRIWSILYNHHNPEEALRELIRAALIGQEGDGGRDNITVILAQIQDKIHAVT